MAKGLKAVPVGLKKVPKGRHSEKAGYKPAFFATMVYTPSGWQTGRKSQYPYVPPCIPAGDSFTGNK